MTWKQVVICMKDLNNEIIFSKPLIVEKLNNYFINVRRNLANKIETLQIINN